MRNCPKTLQTLQSPTGGLDPRVKVGQLHSFILHKKRDTIFPLCPLAPLFCWFFSWPLSCLVTPRRQLLIPFLRILMLLSYFYPQKKTQKKKAKSVDPAFDMCWLTFLLLRDRRPSPERWSGCAAVSPPSLPPRSPCPPRRSDENAPPRDSPASGWRSTRSPWRRGDS